jgi:aminoglycoside/choline kinase family phosphotransferase
MNSAPPGEADVRARIDRFLDDSGLRSQNPQVLPLPGDASDRRYVRVHLSDGSSQILSVYPGAVDIDASPFVNVAGLLHAMPVPIPRILARSGTLGILALEDLGDVTLQAHLENVSPDTRMSLYREAVGLIHTIQHRGRALASPAYVPYGLSFDRAKLVWELEFFTTHFLEAFRRATLTEASRTALMREFSVIADELADEPQVVCHRDYHSRNLMLHHGQLYVIDFQDARMGPDTYDLASLLRDSYVDVSDQEVEALIAAFIERRAASAHEDRDFRRRFDLMALQRNLKALGTFGFQATSRRKTAYVQYVPRTLNHVRANLGRYSRFGRLRELLAAHLDELR